MESLRGMARIMNSLADVLVENKELVEYMGINYDTVEVMDNTSVDIKEETELYDTTIELEHHVRDRSGSVDSGFGDFETDSETGLELISLEQVSYHCTIEDGWMVIYDKVYEVSEYLERRSHPGGEDVMMEYLGYDGTMAFRGVGHTRGAIRMMEKYVLGILPRNERLNFTP